MAFGPFAAWKSPCTIRWVSYRNRKLPTDSAEDPVFFSEEFPNMAQGYGVSWLRVLDAVEALGADIFVPGHGPIPEDPRGTRAGLHRMRQILIDARDAIQIEVARGSTEDQAVAAVKLQQYEKLPTYAAQREVTVRRMYKELTGNLP